MIDDDFEWFVDRAIEKGVAGAVIFSVDPYEFRERVSIKTESGIDTEEARNQAYQEALNGQI